jgi:hypothetical protein
MLTGGLGFSWETFASRPRRREHLGWCWVEEGRWKVKAAPSTKYLQTGTSACAILSVERFPFPSVEGKR